MRRLSAEHKEQCYARREQQHEALKTLLDRLAFAGGVGTDFAGQLLFVGFDDGLDEAKEAALDFRATRGVVHLHPGTLAPG